MTQTLTKYEKYQADYQTLTQSQGDQPKWIRDLREKAMSRFNEIGMPTARRGNEAWKYTNVRPIAESEFGLSSASTHLDVSVDDIKKTAPWNENWITLVFVDGKPVPALSNGLGEVTRVTVKTIAEGLASGDSTLEAQLSKQINFDEDGFSALNTAFITDGALVRIEDDAVINHPVHLIFASTAGNEALVSHPRVLVVAGKHSKATVIESYVSLGSGNYLTNGVSEIVLDDGADLEHYRLMDESDIAYHVGALRVQQHDNSTFTSRVFERSVGIGRYDLYNKVDGSGCYVSHNGLYMTTGKQHIDNYININHTKPHSTSRLYYKGIIADSSRAVFGGTVWVQEGAIKTDSNQQDKNLLLSPDAEADSKPALFIWADDVVCGHGASAGNIDPDTVFYMRSRGIDLEEASKLLIYGFAAEIIETVNQNELRDYLEGLFLQALPKYKFEFAQS